MSTPNQRHEDEPEDLRASPPLKNDNSQNNNSEDRLEAKERRRTVRAQPRRTARDDRGDRYLPPPKGFSYYIRWIGFVMGSLIAIGVGISFVWEMVNDGQKNQQKKQAEQEFAPVLMGYSKRITTLYPETQCPPAKGKYLPVDAKIASLDPIYHELDKELRADTKEEVGTIVQIRWEQRVVGKYSKHGDAKQWTCTVQLVDNATKMAYPPKQFVGSMPPERGSEWGASGEKPHEEIKYYLKAMLIDGNSQ